MVDIRAFVLGIAIACVVGCFTFTQKNSEMEFVVIYNDHTYTTVRGKNITLISDETPYYDIDGKKFFADSLKTIYIRPEFNYQYEQRY